MLTPVALFCHHLCSHNVKRSHEKCMNVAGGSHHSCIRKWLSTQGLALSDTRKDLSRLAKTVNLSSMEISDSLLDCWLKATQTIVGFHWIGFSPSPSTNTSALNYTDLLDVDWVWSLFSVCMMMIVNTFYKWKQELITTYHLYSGAERAFRKWKAVLALPPLPWLR